VRPKGWIDLRACRSVDGYRVDNQADRSIFPYCVMCTFKNGRFEFRCEQLKQADEWLLLIRRVQFECNNVQAKAALDVTEVRLASTGPLLQKLVRCGESEEDEIKDILNEFFDLYDDESKGTLELGQITLMLRDLHEVRERMLTTFMEMQLHKRQKSFDLTPAEIWSFEMMQSKANALLAKYRQLKSMKMLANDAVEIRMLMDRERDGTVNKEEFANMARNTLFKAEDIREELEIRDLGRGFNRTDDACPAQ